MKVQPCSTDGATWTLRKPNTFLTRDFDPRSDWEGRHTAGYAVHDGRMWIIGGDAKRRRRDDLCRAASIVGSGIPSI